MKKINIKRLNYSLFFLCLTLVFVISGCAKTVSNQTVKVALDYVPNTNHTGLYVAQAKKYFQDQGINVEILQASDVAPETLVASGQADFAFSYQENLTSAIDNGLDLVSLATVYQTNTSGFISRADKNIKTPKDWAGKTYCGWGTEVEKSLVETIAKTNGVDSSEIKITSTGGDILTSDPKNCDFFWVYYGWDGVNAKLGDIQFNYNSVTDYGLDFYSPVVISSTKYTTANPDVTKKFINALGAGYKYTQANPTEAAKILTSQNPEIDEQLAINSQLYLQPYILDENNGWGLQQSEIFASFTNFLSENKLLKTDLDYQKLFTNNYLETK